MMVLFLGLAANDVHLQGLTRELQHILRENVLLKTDIAENRIK